MGPPRGFGIRKSGRENGDEPLVLAKLLAMLKANGQPIGRREWRRVRREAVMRANRCRWETMHRLEGTHIAVGPIARAQGVGGGAAGAREDSLLGPGWGSPCVGADDAHLTAPGIRHCHAVSEWCAPVPRQPGLGSTAGILSCACACDCPELPLGPCQFMRAPTPGLGTDNPPGAYWGGRAT